MKKYIFKGFKIKEIVKVKSVIFVDDTKYINCYGVEIEYPKFKYNVMINHKPINDLMSYHFNKMRNIKPIVEEKIKEFHRINNKYLVVE
jgi:hypothetical protein